MFKNISRLSLFAWVLILLQTSKVAAIPNSNDNSNGISIESSVEIPGQYDPNYLKLEGINAAWYLNYETKDGKKIKPNKIIRSNNTAYLTQKDVDFLINEKNLEIVINLCGNSENRFSKDKFESDDRVSYFGLPFSLSAKDMFLAMRGKKTLIEVYISALEGKDGKKCIKSVFSLLSSLAKQDEDDFTEEKQIAEEKTILLHSNFGKDRVGVVSAILLSILGVEEETVIEDYTKAYKYIKEDKAIKRIEKSLGETGKELTASKPNTMKEVLDHLKKEYGSCEGYLNDCGITTEDINKIRTLLLEPDLDKHDETNESHDD